MKEGDFRIVEYVNYFKAQVCIRKLDGFKFLGLYSKYKLEWNSITTNGYLYHWRKNLPDSISFKTKEDAEKAILNFKKYPIFHNL